MKISVVLVHHGSVAAASVALASARAAYAVPGVVVEAVVVDNGSPEPWPADAPSDAALRTGQNLGFARAANLGAARATGDLLLFLNPDARLLAEGALGLTAAALDGAAAGPVGPRLVGPDGGPGVSAGYYPWRLRRLLGHWWPAAGRPPLGAERTVVDWVPATAMVIGRELFSVVGGFCEDYFMYFEDVELCLRLRRLGQRSCVVPTAVAVHQGAGSWAGREAERRAAWRRSRRRFLVSCGSLRGRLLASFLDLVGVEG